MNSLINNICKVQYAKIEEIASISENHINPATVSATWSLLDCAPGAILTITPSYPAEGPRHSANFTCTMRTPISSANLRYDYIILITLDDDTTLLIGNPDHPVKLFQNQSLQSKTLTFTHTSWHHPHSITPDSSGSSSGGI